MEKLNFGKLTYIVEAPYKFGIDTRIEFNSEIPVSLYKYYSPSKYNFLSFPKCEFFCSHPYQFNDLTDSNPLSYDFTNLSFDNFKGIYLDLGTLNENEVRDMYNEDKSFGFKSFRAHFYSLLTQHLGIICLSGNEMHNLMWGYYSSDSGFRIKYNTKMLINSIEEEFLFFPVNYIDNKLHIDIDKYGTHLPVLLDISTKVKHWEHENEWRISIFKNDMSVPSSLITPHLDDYTGSDSRLVNYDLNSIEEVVLGINFFNGKLVSKSESLSNTELIITVKQEEANQFLSFLAKNMIGKVFMAGIFTDKDYPVFDGAFKMERSIEAIEIEQLDNDKFCIVRVNPGFCKRYS